jgi:hypothetical protein
LAGNNSFELEINTLFQEGNTLETVCTEIVNKYEKSEVISPSELESLSHFLTQAGRVDLLFNLYLKSLKKNSISYLPWGCFAAASKIYDRDVLEELSEIIEFAFNQTQNFENAVKYPPLSNYVPSLTLQIDKIKENFNQERLKLKTKLISQLNHNRLYQLSEQEEQTLQQLVRQFPQDSEVKLLHQAHLEKKADEILIRARAPSSKKYSKKIIESPSKDADEFIKKIEDTLLQLVSKLEGEAPDQIYNITLLALQFNLWDLSLQLINRAPKTHAGEWLKAEILFESARYLDLLKHIEMIERTMTATPDATYGALYLKAQAYHGLGQKEMAIQLLESLSAKVHSYRSTEALIHEWKNS